VTDDARRAAALAARASYGRLLAYLARRSRDLAAAEDALGDAFVAALATWPRDGIPERPEAWLLAAARRRLLDAGRHAGVRTRAWPALEAVVDEAQGAASSVDGFPDERLALLFVCAHPAIDEGMRTPLMLQTVLGLDAARVAAAFLVPAPTMGQRLVRVKTKIRDAGMRFEVPGPDELAPRLGSVLGAIYAAYGSGWDDVAGADTRRRGLAEEAIWLGRLVARLLADEPETLGLLALMLHCEARRAARRDAAGAYVPLSEQDVSRWARPMIDEAEEVLRRASRAGRPGRFQLEAAVQSAHAAALAETRGAEAGLAALVAVPAAAVVGYQPFWALRGHLLGRLRRVDEAAQAYARAIALGEDPAVRRFLEEKACVLRTG
jgi:RNA polymerase sigma-70 factor (ECF subfamily)